MLGIAAVLACGTFGLANATPVDLITNGTFADTLPAQSTPTQFGPSSGSCNIGSRTWGGQFIDGWSGRGNNGYEIWYPSAGAASTVQACTTWGNTGNQLLPAAVTAPPAESGATAFVGLDGASSYRAGVSQLVSGLVAGQRYVVNFWWASTQEMSETGATTEQLAVSLGDTAYDGQKFTTATNSIDTHGWSGWVPVSFTFTATSASEYLSFLSVGTPGSLPPFGLLTGVSMYAVPEPPQLGLFGLGVLGVGVLTVVARRRALRRRDDNA